MPPGMFIYESVPHTDYACKQLQCQMKGESIAGETLSHQQGSLGRGGSPDGGNYQVRFRNVVAGRATRNLKLGTLGLSVQISYEKVNEKT